MRFNVLPVLFILLFNAVSFSQENSDGIDPNKIRRYVPLDNVLAKGISLTRNDSLNFHFSEGDTLVLITPALEKFFPMGIQVRIEPQDSLFIEKYKTIVYGPLNSPNRNKQSPKIWKDGIRLYFDPSVPKQHQKALWKFAQRLSSQVDSLHIQKVSKRNKANYFVFYRNTEEAFDLEPRITDTRSGYYLNWINNSFSRATLKVNSFSFSGEKEIINDLKRRFFETLGYFKSSDKLTCGSMLATCGEYRAVSEEDLDLLKYHYSYQNCYGIDLKEFECQHEQRRQKFTEYPYIKMYVSHLKK